MKPNNSSPGGISWRYLAQHLAFSLLLTRLLFHPPPPLLSIYCPSTVTLTTCADCATGFGDLVADALGLHMRPHGYNLFAVGLFALTAFAIMVITVEVKGRHTGILEGLRQQSSNSSRRTQDRKKTATATELMKIPLARDSDRSMDTTPPKNQGICN